MIALVALMAVACGKVEKILPKGTGMWKISSSREVSYMNDSLLSDVTRTDSLGQIFFGDDGTGYSTEFGSTTKDNFTWTVNSDNDVLTILPSDTGAIAMPADILESSSKQMTIFFSVTAGVAPFVAKFEGTQILDRIK